MDIEMVARNIQIILAPVVMVTACAILLQGLLARYASLNERLRNLAIERLKLLYESAQDDKYRVERLRLVDKQLPLLLGHYRRSRNAVVTVYGAALIFIADMFVIAFAAMNMSSWLATVALLIFLSGVVALFSGVLLVALELRTSHQALQFEVTSVLALDDNVATAANSAHMMAVELTMQDPGL